MKLVLAVLIGIFHNSQQQFLVSPTKTTPEQFPYHAYVSSDLYCLGALISIRYVVVNAICIETQTKATVYLGTRQNPYYDFLIIHGQEIPASELITHPQFSKRFSDSLLVNNIGLVKLRDPALITSTVQPIRLASKLDFPLMPGTLLNITGYMDSVFSSKTLRYTTVAVRAQNECLQFYGRHIIMDDEQCVQGLGSKRLHWPGPLAKDGKLVGISRVLSREAECVAPRPPCNPRDVFLSFEIYLDWIYANSDVSKETFQQGIIGGPNPIRLLPNRIKWVNAPALVPNLASQKVIAGQPNMMIRPVEIIGINPAVPNVVIAPTPPEKIAVPEFEEKETEDFEVAPPKKGAER